MSGQCKEGREQRPTVVVLGGRFGGIGAVRKLADAGADVNLVDHSAGVPQSSSFGVSAPPVYLALLSTGEDRAEAVIDWTLAGLAHERPSRITVRTDVHEEERRAK